MSHPSTRIVAARVGRLALLAFISAANLRADSIEYTLTLNPQVTPYFGPLSFQYIAPDFITSTGYADASSLNYCNLTPPNPGEEMSL